MWKSTFCCFPVTKCATGDFRVNAVVEFFSFDSKIRWPFMVASSTAFNAFISTKPLTVNQSHQELVMSVMADGSKKYSLIYWQLLPQSYSRCCWKLYRIPHICALIQSAGHNSPKSKLVLCLHFPFLYMMSISSIF